MCGNRNLLYWSMCGKRNLLHWSMGGKRNHGTLPWAGKGYSHWCADQKWSRGTVHKPWGLEERWNKHGKSKRKIVSLLIWDKRKKTVSVLGHYILLPYREEEIVSSYIEKSKKIPEETFKLLPLKSGNFDQICIFRTFKQWQWTDKDVQSYVDHCHYVFNTAQF